ncbi:hypothetical protein HF086_003353 [Spodoptera exigua]|uniref:MULE transposase domain-containing protein n=1 Tax=Spodoptera exigua TaxID=7107 RepID=A0A922MY14_SPOEX|nr:hypothetical protein HF086_003353 [Spodoptera exigua]
MLDVVPFVEFKLVDCKLPFAASRNSDAAPVAGNRNSKEIICQVEDFYADGTFKSCSPPFDQLYTIHGDIGSTANHTNLMPLVYALMSNRTTESYKILFMLIKAEIPKWSPKRIKTDYERAAMKAIVDVFPCVELKGCYFHFNKAIWAKGRELSLTNTKDIKKRRLVALSAVLPLLPKTEVMNGWAYIMRHENDDSAVKKFKAYMEKQWLKDKFIPIWNAFGEKHRTTNSLESWHHKLNCTVGKKTQFVAFTALFV